MSLDFQKEFPWREFDLSKLEKEYISLQKNIKKYNLISGNIISYKRIGINCSDVFFQYARLSTVSQDRTEPCTVLWNTWRERILKYHNERMKKKKNDLYGTITFMFHPPSHFSPFVAGMIYKYFNAKTVFDPYAGWGNRCLAAMSSNVNYIGVDCNPDLNEPFENLLKTYKHESKVVFISNRAENVNIEDYQFELTFSSPPFWNEKKMLEKYKNSEINYENFLETSLFPVFEKCIKKSIVCLYINEKMYNSLKEKFGSCHEIINFKSPSNSKKSKFRENQIYCWKS
jgi:16S rRNA G966 N2-methylase RsmD